MRPPKVISYTRFSSRKQARGDSLRRQTEAAQDWCREHGYELDTSLAFRDLGISGFSGANLTKGALSGLLQLCHDGKLTPGTILLVEAFDRLTRLPLPDATALLLDLVRAGLTIVTLTDRKTWDQSTLENLPDFLMSILSLYRGHQESDYKAKRLRKTFAHHRDKRSQQAFGSAPGWLHRESKSHPWIVDEGKAEVVRRVFALAAEGYGSKAIAKRANEERWPVPTRLNMTEGRWHAQMPGQLLRNRAVLGEHEHRVQTHEARNRHWRGQSTGLVIGDYYPRIVSDEQWNLARASVDTRQVAKRRDEHYFNIWSGLLFCGYCGAPLHRKTEFRGRSRGSVVCSDKLAGLTDCPSMAANHLDITLLDNVYKLGVINNMKPGDDREREMATLEAKLSELAKSNERLVEAVASTSAPVQALAKKIEAVSQEMHQLRLKLEEVRQAQMMEESETFFDESFLEHAAAHLYQTGRESQDVRASLHLSMARLVDTIWVWSYELAMVKLKHGDPVHYVVPLPHKQLPSRANPSAKYHKPPKPKLPPPTPHLDLALKGQLEPPNPRRSKGLPVANSTPYLLADEE